MIYLNFRNDYLQKFEPSELMEVLSQNPLDRDEALMDVEAMTASTLSGYLEERYDLQGLKGKKYRKSIAQLHRWATHIAAYLLFEQAGLKAKEEIKGEYDRCMTELQLIKEGSTDWLAPVSKLKAGMQWLPDEDLDLGTDDSMFLDLY